MLKRRKITVSILLSMSLAITSCSRSEDTVNSPEEVTTPTIVEETTQAEETSGTVTATKPAETDELVETTEETTTAEETTAAATTTTEKVVTTPVTEGAPVPEWTENAINKTTMYVNTNGIYSRKKAVMGSTAVKQYALNTAVTVVALTNTNYYKLSDGTYIHKDYLSIAKVTVTTTTTTKPVTTTTTTAATTEPEFVFTEEIRLQYEKEAARLINEFRVQNGLPALIWDETIHQATRIRSDELDKYYSHDRPNGENNVDLLVELGYWDSVDEFWELATQSLAHAPRENIGEGQDTPEIIVQDWINSEGHKEGLLDTNSLYMAVGVYYSEEWDWYSWVFWCV